METLTENYGNQQWLQYSNMKGRSTAFIFNKALYATDMKSNRTILACLIHGLNPLEMRRLQFSMNELELAILQNDGYAAMLRTQSFK